MYVAPIDPDTAYCRHRPVAAKKVGALKKTDSQPVQHLFRFALLSVICGLFVVISSGASCSACAGSGCDDDADGSSGSIIKSVTMTKTVKGDTDDPGAATTVFRANEVVYAVVAIKNAPKGTQFRGRFIVVDVGSVAEPGFEIDAVELTADGTRNLKFSLEPGPTGFPAGKYKVEISVNGEVQKTLD
ncbi:MAG: hypothetical protein ABI782_03935, partial [Anaerolineaceae bacterium]